ncbi:MAG TPA: hypothetical protein VHF89_16125 [Solirubrobacteraceae bacterium]|nr:hypothetical protein [Solirubrobacteraceae bacterium]
MSRTLTRIVVGAIAATCVITPTAALSASKAEKQRARMTGGGHFQARSAAADNARVKATHGFALYCNAATEPQRLEVNWSGGNSFHLTDIATASCSDSPLIDQENPEAPIDTYRGTGAGRLNFGSGAKEEGFADWKFVDGGEPGGGADQIRITIWDADGDVVLSTSTRPLTKGNHQAHRGTGSKA